MTLVSKGALLFPTLPLLIKKKDIHQEPELMLLETNFPLNFTKLWILLLVNLMVVSRTVSSNTQVASSSVPVHLLDPLTRHRKNSGADCQYSEMNRDYVSSEITLKVSL